LFPRPLSLPLSFFSCFQVHSLSLLSLTFSALSLSFTSFSLFLFPNLLRPRPSHVLPAASSRVRVRSAACRV
jgi:hypothetical protein